MDINKINDFVNIWAQTIGLQDKRSIDIIKNDIIKRCDMYEDVYSSISVEQDPCAAYIIKPTNGVYSLEDFLLNRLMLGLREVDFKGALEGNGGEYTSNRKLLNINAPLLSSHIKDKATRHTGLEGQSSKIITKTIEHELGHCLKTLFSDGYKAPLGNGREQDAIYENLINNLTRYENGKYANQIKSFLELEADGQSDPIKTGVHDSEKSYEYDYRFTSIDELLNETEALELTDSDEVHEIWALQDKNGKDSSSGNYVNVYNYISGYRSFSGYGSIFKALLGKEDSFYAEYISSNDIFKQFDEEYGEIVQEVWGIDPKQFPPIKCLFMDFSDLQQKQPFNEKIMLKLDEFFARCYEKKIDKSITQNNGTICKDFCSLTLEEIEKFQARLTTNSNPQKRDALAHNVIFNNIKTRINELVMQNEQSSIEENKQPSKISNEVATKQIRSIEITKLLNPSLLRQKITLPNGAEISTNQYIQEMVAPHIPSSGKFILQNGAEVPAKQYIEEYILGEGQQKYNGNISKLLAENTRANNGTITLRGEQIGVFGIVDTINPTLMQKMLSLPNGTQIPAKQFIEEAVIFEGQEKFGGDINALLDAMTVANNGTISVEITKSHRGQGLKQEMRGISIEQEELEKHSKVEKKISGKSTKSTVANPKVTKVARSDANRKTEIMSEREERRRLNAERANGTLTAEKQQRLHELNRKLFLPPQPMPRQQNGQKKNKGMGIGR